MHVAVITALVIASPLRSGGVEDVGLSPVTVKVEQRLCRGHYVAVGPSPYAGLSLKFMVRFPGWKRAVFKPHQTRYSARFMAEIAAYRLATHLGVSMVPPACERSFPLKELRANTKRYPKFLARMAKELVADEEGEVRGALIHWVARVKNLYLETRKDWQEWLKPGAVVPKRHGQLAQDISDMLLMDLLFSNPDRFTGGNTMAARDSGRLLMIDNGAAFRPVESLVRPYHKDNLQRLGRVRRSTYQRVLGLTDAILKQVLRRPADRGFYLTSRERRALIFRRDELRRHVEGLRRQHGDGQVFFP